MAKKARSWRVEKKGNNVHVLHFDGIKSGWQQWVLLQSDEQWTNPATTAAAQVTADHSATK